MFVVGVALISGCTPTEALPTLAPTTVPVQITPQLTTPTLIITPTAAPTDQIFDLPTKMPLMATASLTRIPTRIATSAVIATSVPPTQTEPPSLPAIEAAQNGDTFTIRVSTLQLNQALAAAFQDGNGLDSAPVVTLDSGVIRVLARIDAKSIVISLSAAALPTTQGRVLDIRAVAVSDLQGLSTQQAKRAQNLVEQQISALVSEAAKNAKLDYQSVAVTPDLLTITVALR